MSHATFFVQECPTCGRRLQIRVAHLGRKLYCQHCGGAFRACDSGASVPAEVDPHTRLLERAEQLLAYAELGRIPAPPGTGLSGSDSPVKGTATWRQTPAS